MKKVAFLLILLSCAVFGQRHTDEVHFSASPIDTTTKSVSMSAVNGLTRWAPDGDDKLPTSGRSYFSGTFADDPEPQHWGVDAPTENGVAWGKYSVSFGCSDDGFSRNFYLDLRDANWPDSPYITPDINITYYPDNASAYKLKAQCDGGSNWISSGETIRVWSLAGNSQNKTELLIPVSATNDWEDGNIKMGGTTFAVPESLNWGWSTTHALEAITPQTDDDIIYTFTEWDNGSGTNPFNLTTDDSHDSYDYTAEFSCKPVIPDNFSGQIYNNHPKLTWTALTGSTISGYKVYRNYNKGGYQYVTSLTPKTVNQWVDYDYTTQGSPTYVTYYRITAYTSECGESDYPTAIAFWTRLALKSKDKDEEKSNSFSIKNYPNPFNPGTTIQYTLAEECQVRIAIYNFAGQHIKTLLSSTRSAGNHDLVWNGKDRYGTPVSAGVYFYKISAISLQANSKTGPWNYTGKMILVK